MLVVLAAVGVAGCGGTFDAKVAGHATLDGRSLERGFVTFHPIMRGPTGYGVIDNGDYRVSTGREPGVPSGEYLVTIVSNEESRPSADGAGPPTPGRQLTPERLSRKETTDLRYTIKPGDNRIDLDLSTP